MNIDAIQLLGALDSSGVLIQVIATVGTLVTLSTTLVATLRAFVPVLEWLAGLTATSEDDLVVSNLGQALDNTADRLRATARACDRTSLIGPGE